MSTSSSPGSSASAIATPAGGRSTVPSGRVCHTNDATAGSAWTLNADASADVHTKSRHTTVLGQLYYAVNVAAVCEVNSRCHLLQIVRGRWCHTPGGPPLQDAGTHAINNTQRSTRPDARPASCVHVNLNQQHPVNACAAGCIRPRPRRSNACRIRCCLHSSPAGPGPSRPFVARVLSSAAASSGIASMSMPSVGSTSMMLK
jgi:hypothetical protein